MRLQSKTSKFKDIPIYIYVIICDISCTSVGHEELFELYCILFFSLSDYAQILEYSDPSISFYGMRVGISKI